MEGDAATVVDLLIKGGPWTIVFYLWTELKTIRKETRDDQREYREEQRAHLTLYQELLIKARNSD
ncbi:MAG: hypothetical protein ACPGVG_17430 [Mycobacterium sp.]